MPLTRIKSSAIGDDAIISRNLADDIEFSGDFIKLPVGGTADRPASPENGHLRYNTDFARLEQYSGGQWQAIDTPPTITSVTYPNSQTGLDPAGGETFIITGLNFQSGATVDIAGTSASTVTVDSSTQITITTPAKAAGDYNLNVTNTNGLTATLTNGISFNGIPAFTTAADLGDLAGSTAISGLTIVAAEPDSGTLAYSISTPASPDFVSINSSTGVLSGTTPAGGSANTDYTFEVTATDDENQTNSRTYTITVLRKIYAYSIPQSLMFNDDDSQYLSWTAGTPTDRKKFTFSCWVKRGLVNTTAEKGLFAAGTDNSNHTNFGFGTNTDTLQFQHRPGDASGGHVFYRSTAQYSDPSAWYHIVLTIDTTQASASDRIKVYVNGVQDTTFVLQSGKDEIQLNEEFEINQSGKLHVVGARKITSIDSFHDGYMAEVHFIDGQALTYTSFAETYNDVYVPKDYTGAYGDNGFHLPMTNDTSVEAFNAVTYTGNSQSFHAINGMGFQPDLLWVKIRTGQNDNNIVVDSVRGPTKQLFGGSNVGENTRAEVSAFTSDGFTLGTTDGSSNSSGYDYVAWGWKAGGSSDTFNIDGTGYSTASAAGLTNGYTTPSAASVNTTYGFSIITYTGSSSNTNNSIDHGLGVAPAMYFTKNRNGYNDSNGFSDWNFYHKDLAQSGNSSTNGPFSMFLTSTNAAVSGVGGITDVPTSTLFYPAVTNYDNSTAGTYIAYIWAEKTGYSKFGSWTSDTGNVSVTTGFRPALLMVKCSSHASQWEVIDNTRDTVSPHTKGLRWNSTGQEFDYVSDLSQPSVAFSDTGFTITGQGDTLNLDGRTFVYAAFADTRDSAFWRDESGNNNDWQPENTGAYRISTDTPTGTN